MHILVTNDDGVNHPGLLALAQAARRFGKVTVLAPDKNWSVSGHVKTLNRPLRVKKTTLADGTPAFACDGAPSDCVALADLGFLNEPVDLVLSGINPYPNLGHDVTYSGTVTAAMEAAIWGIRGIAFSLDGGDEAHDLEHFLPAARNVARVLDVILKHDFPREVVLNVNIPHLPGGEPRGVRITRQGLRIYLDQLICREDPRGVPYYWIGGDAPGGVQEEGTDIGMLAQGYITITPLHLDLTAHDLLADLQTWEWE